MKVSRTHIATIAFVVAAGLIASVAVEIVANGNTARADDSTAPAAGATAAVPAATPAPAAPPAVPVTAATPSAVAAPAPSTYTISSGTPTLVTPIANPAVPVMPAPTYESGRAFNLTPVSDKNNELKIFSLKNADADTMAQQLKEIISGRVVVVADKRTNQVLVRGDSEGVAMAESIAMKLDEASANRPQKPASLFGSSSSQNTIVKDGTASGKVTIAEPGPRRWPIAVQSDSKSDSNTASSTAGQGGGGFGAFSGGFGGSTGGGGGGSFGGGGFRSGSFGTTANTNWESVFPNMQALEKQLREAEETAKKAEAAAKDVEELMKKIEASSKTGVTTEEGQLRAKLKELAEMQRLAAEDQRRASEAQRRMAESSTRAAEVAKRVNVAPWAAVKSSRQSPEDAKTDDRINDLAAGVRELQAADKLTDEQKKRLEDTRAKIKDLLDSKLQNQEKTQRDDVKQLRERLEKLEKEISDRAQNRQSIIERKLQDLLSANSTRGASLDVDGKKLIIKAGSLTADDHGTVTIEGPVTVTTSTEPLFGSGESKDDSELKTETSPAPKKTTR